MREHENAAEILKCKLFCKEVKYYAPDNLGEYNDRSKYDKNC